MLRFLLPALLALLTASAAQAQIHTLHFKEEKYAKPYKDRLIEWQGEQVVLVEVHSGINRSPVGKLTWPPDARLGFYVMDPGDPLKLPYVISDGSIKKEVRKQVIKINADRVKGLGTFMPDESFYTLSVQYQRRLDKIERIEAKRKEADRGSKPWFEQHSLLLTEMDGLHTWLVKTGYSKAASSLAKTLAREKRKGDAAKGRRLADAVASRKLVPTNEKLALASAKVGTSGLDFQVQESTHLRIVYHTGIEEGKVGRLLELGEKAIDAFRVALVDPYASTSFADRIPDELFIEYFFSDDHRGNQEKMLEEYYGLGWGDGERRQKALATAGSSRRVERRALSYWRTDERADLEGILIHALGHELARIHYGISGNQQDWLEEGVGYYLSFKLLGRNNVSCTAFEPPRDEEETVSRGPKGGRKDKDFETTVKLRGIRDVMAGVALQSGPPFTQLSKKGLFDFRNPDMAKSWAFYAFIVDEMGLEGQVWLRGLDRILRAEDYPIKLREHTAEVFADLDGNAVKQLEERWEAFLRKNFDV